RRRWNATNFTKKREWKGNAWEWTGDWYNSNYYADGQVDPTGPRAGAFRVLRGGSWPTGADLLRASDRMNGDPTLRNNVIGFRCSSN
ncbi:MAG: SUMF1/EgtB/PvdO family nonheme iron enzyme, partial [Nitrospinae bacterium]|nr:SUMF1/EgtB/PvdO family nonheme iron enzyme [Nitrospinota bacterium]